MKTASKTLADASKTNVFATKQKQEPDFWVLRYVGLKAEWLSALRSAPGSLRCFASYLRYSLKQSYFPSTEAI